MFKKSMIAGKLETATLAKKALLSMSLPVFYCEIALAFMARHSLVYHNTITFLPYTIIYLPLILNYASILGGMTISVWFIIAQLFGVVAIIFEFVSYQIKDKRKYLLVNGIGGIFWTFMFVAMGLSSSMSTQISLIIVGVYTSTRALVFWWIFAKDTKRRRTGGRIFLLVMIIIAISAGIFVISGLPTREVQILQSVVLVFALGFVIGQYMPGKHPVRITVFLYAIMLFLTQTPLNIIEGNGIERWNIMGMLIETSKMASVLVFYYLFLQKKILTKKLVKIKEAVNCELSKITPDSDIAAITNSGIMKLSELEKLVAKMVRMEIKIIETDEITNVGSSEAKTQAIMDNLKTVHDVKMLLEKAIKARMIPKFSLGESEIKETILGKSGQKEEVTNV